MADVTKKGFPVAGVIFLVLALYELISGDDWVVWFILGILFGGLGAFQNASKRQGDA